MVRPRLGPRRRRARARDWGRPGVFIVDLSFGALRIYRSACPGIFIALPQRLAIILTAVKSRRVAFAWHCPTRRQARAMKIERRVRSKGGTAPWPPTTPAVPPGVIYLKPAGPSSAMGNWRWPGWLQTGYCPGGPHPKADFFFSLSQPDGFFLDGDWRSTHVFASRPSPKPNSGSSNRPYGSRQDPPNGGRQFSTARSVSIGAGAGLLASREQQPGARGAEPMPIRHHGDWFFSLSYGIVIGLSFPALVEGGRVGAQQTTGKARRPVLGRPRRPVRDCSPYGGPRSKVCMYVPALSWASGPGPPIRASETSVKKTSCQGVWRSGPYWSISD